MLPAQLQAAQFAVYPPNAQALAVRYLPLLRELPVSFLPSLLRELVEYDFQFPLERRQMEAQLTHLAALPAIERAQWFAGFAVVRVAPEQAAMDWCGRPVEFTEQFSAYLWRTHQMDAFRSAATAYGDRMHAAIPAEKPVTQRLGIAVIGQGATVPAGVPLFRKLREHGTLFTNIDPADGLPQLLAAAEARARLYPKSFAHWYVDGGAPLANGGALTVVSYAGLAPAREALLRNIQQEVNKAGMGPEALRDHLMHLEPGHLGMNGNAVLDKFLLKILTEGQGTQIFSTTFAQWTAREVLRRAEPATLLVRFAPRQRQRPMNELLAAHTGVEELDPQGSLVDADMAAYYQWMNQQRLPGAEDSAFAVWLEGGKQALAVGPSLPRGTVSKSAVSVAEILKLAAA